MPGTLAGMCSCLEPTKREFCVVIAMLLVPRPLRRFPFDTAPDLGRQRVGHLLLEVGYKADGTRHYGKSAAHLPGYFELTGDGANRAGGVDREVAAERRGRFI